MEIRPIKKQGAKRSCMRCVHFEEKPTGDFGCTRFSLKELFDSGYLATATTVPDPKTFICEDNKEKSKGKKKAKVGGYSGP